MPATTARIFVKCDKFSFIKQSQGTTMRCRWTWCLLVGLLVANVAAGADVVVEKAARRITLKNSWAKVIDTITAKASGSNDLSEFVVCYPEHLASRMSLLKVLIKKERQDIAPLDELPAGAPAAAKCFKATFKPAVKKGTSVEFDAVATITGVFVPNPAKIEQAERQYVEYQDNLYLLSPYIVESQGTVVQLPTSDIKSSTDIKASTAGSKITYGDYGKQQPWAVQELKVHFHHDKPFKRVNKLVREIEVSHWGNIYVEETYEIQNAGSEHKGKFSRLTYFYSPTGKTNSFPDVRAKLPGPAHSLYYKDLIGNISSSNTVHTAKQTAIELRLRYPLMGGWKTDFMLGYSLPLEGFLYRRPKGKLRLLMDLSTSFDDVWVEELETRVVLPEGAKNIKPSLPFDGVDVSWDKKFTYLDTEGRPVLVLRKHNAVPEHNKLFAVDYTFSIGAMMREPLLLIGVFAALFIAVSVYNRLDFTITKDDRWQDEQAQDKARGILQKLLVLWEREADLLNSIINLSHSISNDASADYATKKRQQLEGNIKAVDADAKVLLRELEEVSAKSAAAARDHGDKSKTLQQRAVKLLSDKGDLVRRGTAPHEAATKLEGPTQQLLDATTAWVDSGIKMADA